MEWSWRTILILFGLLTVIGIVADGFRRMRLARLEASREEFNPELPAGRARVVSEPVQPAAPAPQAAVPQTPTPQITAQEPAASPASSFLDSVKSVKAKAMPKPKAKPQPKAQPKPQPAMEAQPSVNLDEQVPVLLDVETLGSDTAHVQAQAAAVAEPAEALLETPVATSAVVEPQAQTQATEQPEQAAVEPAIEPAIVEEVVAVEPEPEPEPSLVEQLLLLADPSAEKPSERPENELSLVVHCIAPEGKPYSGVHLLQLFNHCDIRLGDRNLFHRYEERNGKGAVQFSIMPTYAPQQFSTKELEERSYKGLSLFMKLPGPAVMLESYDVMIGVAKVLESNFAAELFDKDGSALTPQTIEHGRQQIIELSHRQKVAEKKRMRG